MRDDAVAAPLAKRGCSSDEIVYDAYGVAADLDRIRYYRALWDLA